jgi:hypothetical protein
MPVWLQELEAWARIFQALITPILIAIGGIFAWYKFFRQGEHDPRLQPTVTGSVTVKENVAYIVATVSVINTGQVDVELDLEFSGLVLLTRRQGHGWREPELKYSVFPGQERAQPGATLEDQIWIELPHEDEVAIVLELTVTGHTVTKPEGYTWKTIEIVSLLDGGNLSADG